MLLRGFEGWHLVILALLVTVLFGARRMPDAARSIGQSLRIFKSEMKAGHEDGAGHEGGAGGVPAAESAAPNAAATTPGTAAAQAEPMRLPVSPVQERAVQDGLVGSDVPVHATSHR